MIIYNTIYLDLWSIGHATKDQFLLHVKRFCDFMFVFKKIADLKEHYYWHD